MDYGHQFSKTRFRAVPEKNSGKTLVETAGYISAQKRIENMILAGQHLVDFRKSQFDFPDKDSINDDFYDPTRSKNYDMADASQARIAIAHKYNNVQKNVNSEPAAATEPVAATEPKPD